jgi:hypothetical protein
MTPNRASIPLVCSGGQSEIRLSAAAAASSKKGSMFDPLLRQESYKVQRIPVDYTATSRSS